MNISEAERDALYKVIYARRDVRSEYLPKPVPDEIIARIIQAGHNAPSVGFSQPWDFIVVKEQETKEAIKRGFDKAHAESAEMFDGVKRETYKQFKLEGIMEAPLGICVTCDRQKNGPVVIGRTIKPEMDLYSSVCAVQNMWLAARAENLGLGWVSILHDEVLRENLGIPEDIDIVAYLCIGYVSHFHEKPELEKAGWLERDDIANLTHAGRWTGRGSRS